MASGPNRKAPDPGSGALAYQRHVGPLDRYWDISWHPRAQLLSGAPAESFFLLRPRLLLPGEADFDTARRVWNGTVDRMPAAIVACQGVADVIDAMRFAEREGLGVSVRGGGHHVAGGAVLDGGLVIDVSAMRSVRVDPDAGTVRAEGGALIADVDREGSAFGLFAPLGLYSQTGIGGFTLGGGLGWMRRSAGMACDNLVSADVVTADGRLLTASATQHEDLFWALRGGGWDLGVVTSFEYRAQRIDPEVFFLFVAYPIDEAERILAALNGFMATAPDGAKSRRCPLDLPDAWRRLSDRRSTASSSSRSSGPYIGTARRAIASIGRCGSWVIRCSTVAVPIPYLAVQHSFDGEYPVGRRYYWKSVYLPGLPDEVIADPGRASGVSDRHPCRASSLAAGRGDRSRADRRDTDRPAGRRVPHRHRGQLGRPGATTRRTAAGRGTWPRP